MAWAFANVENVRQGKFFDININEKDETKAKSQKLMKCAKNCLQI